MDRRRGKLKKQETDALQQQLRDLQGIISALKLSSDADAVDLLKKIRSGPPEALTPSDTPLAARDFISDYHKSQERDTRQPGLSVSQLHGDAHR